VARRVLNRLALLALLAATAAVPCLGASVYQEQVYRRGETVEINGTVADAGGAPVEGMTVVLVAAHRGFTFRGMRRVEEGHVRVAATTDAQGRFTLEWVWNPYYDAFRIRAEGIGTAEARPAGAGGPGSAVLTEVDLTRRITEGSPVVVALEVADAGPHREGRAFAAAPRSDDQSRVFREMGKPDRVDRLEMSGGQEEAWWYFERGKSFHFRDGRLDQVIDFEPVKGF